MFIQLWQLICGDVDSHDLTRPVQMLAEWHPQALRHLNLHWFFPTAIKCNHDKPGPELFKWF